MSALSIVVYYLAQKHDLKNLHSEGKNSEDTTNSSIMTSQLCSSLYAESVFSSTSRLTSNPIQQFIVMTKSYFNELLEISISIYYLHM